MAAVAHGPDLNGAGRGASQPCFEATLIRRKKVVWYLVLEL